MDGEDGSPDENQAMNGRGGADMQGDDYEEIDYKICGELGKE